MKWKLGEISGIGVYIHWSFWILPAWILFAALSAGGGVGGALASVIFIFAVFGCVVLHELGHAFAARHFGIGTRDITLYPIGGVASLNRMPRKPSQELVIALAGPAVNVVLALALLVPIALGLSTALPLFSPLGGSFLTGLLWVNVALVLFNMLPAFPMDGGRVLRAFLAMSLPYARATSIAAKVGQGIALVLGLLALLAGQWTLLLVAAFVFLAAQGEAAMVQMSEAQGAPFEILEPGQGPGPQSRYAEPDGIVWLTEVRTVDPRTGVVRVVRYPTFR